MWDNELCLERQMQAEMLRGDDVGRGSKVDQVLPEVKRRGARSNICEILEQENALHYSWEKLQCDNDNVTILAIQSLNS